MNALLAKLADNRRPDTLAAILRRRRLRHFQSIIAHLPPPVSVLDVGGTSEFWECAGLSDDTDLRITLLNTEAQRCHPGFAQLAGDATHLEGLVKTSGSQKQCPFM